MSKTSLAKGLASGAMEKVSELHEETFFWTPQRWIEWLHGEAESILRIGQHPKDQGIRFYGSIEDLAQEIEDNETGSYTDRWGFNQRLLWPIEGHDPLVWVFFDKPYDLRRRDSLDWAYETFIHGQQNHWHPIEMPNSIYAPPPPEVVEQLRARAGTSPTGAEIVAKAEEGCLLVEHEALYIKNRGFEMPKAALPLSIAATLWFYRDIFEDVWGAPTLLQPLIYTYWG